MNVAVHISEEPIRFLSREDRKALGHDMSPTTEWRKQKDGLFPKYAKTGSKKGSVVESEFRVHQAILVLEKDDPALGKKIQKWLKAEYEAERNPWSFKKLNAFITSLGGDK